MQQQSVGFVPTDVNRRPVAGVAPRTPAAGYLPAYRLDEIRERAGGYLLNGATALALQAQDVVAMVDELTELRKQRALSPRDERPSWWRRLLVRLRG